MHKKIPIEISARHIHLCQEDLEKLFGKGYKLKKLRELSQHGEFAAQEQLDIEGPKGKIEKVRIIGPVRSKSQVEVSKSDGYKLGDVPPVRVSSDVIGSSGVKLIGPHGVVGLEDGLILAMRHIHMSPKEALEFEVKDRQMVSVKFDGVRSITFHNVIVRVKDTFSLSFQIDTDEANAGGIEAGDYGEIVNEK